MFEIALQNGRIYDPESGKAEVASVGIQDGIIETISSVPLPAIREINAEGLDIVPGFIDIHMHEDSLENGVCDPVIGTAMLRMGVTTAVGGNCGFSPEPLSQYFDFIDRCGYPINLALYLGYNAVRQNLCPSDGGAAFRGCDAFLHFSPAEIATLEPKIREGMRDGALGLSFGLEYSPGCTTEEMIQACRSLRDYGHSLIAAHYRYDADRAPESVSEAVMVSRETKVPFQFSHIGSCAAFGNDSLMNRSLGLLEQARAEGIDILSDCYPYTAFSALIGTAVFDEGCFERWRSSCESIYVAEGTYSGCFCTPEIFAELRKNAPNTRVIGFVMTDAGVDAALRHPLVMVASDGRFIHGHGHPRGAGTFPRVLGRYVRERGVMTFEQAIDKMTLMPAKRLGLSRKGRLQEGCDADLVAFDRNNVLDKADFGTPLLPPEGIRYVFVRGHLCIDGCIMADKMAGRAVRRQNLG
ncbi:MAG: amidohydrolase family protein [Clostridiaceae bacterium]|nr:amidohydrolase family protein [Clostridiaceae bacterium]